MWVVLVLALLVVLGAAVWFGGLVGRSTVLSRADAERRLSAVLCSTAPFGAVEVLAPQVREKTRRGRSIRLKVSSLPLGPPHQSRSTRGKTPRSTSLSRRGSLVPLAYTSG